MRRRIFSPKVTESDPFYSLSVAAQALYFHLNMRADDAGFVTSVRTTMALIHAPESVLSELDGKYLIYFEDEGVALISHWEIHNNLSHIRIKNEGYRHLERQVFVKEDGSYTAEEGELTLYEHKHARGKNTRATDVIPSVSDIRTEPNRTEPNRTEPSASEAEEAEENAHACASSGCGDSSDSSDAEDIPFFPVFGDDEEEQEEIKKYFRERMKNPEYDTMDVVMDPRPGRYGALNLTPHQDDLLYHELGSSYNYYICKLIDYIEETGRNPNNHYQTIKKWAKEDSKV